MTLKRASLLWLIASVAGFGQVLPVTIRVTKETVPPGGMAQMKVLNTSPTPIMRGGMALDTTMLGSIAGVALFSDTGDVAGAAVVDAGHLSVRVVSPNGTFGTNSDYPIMTFTFRPAPGLLPGQTFPVNLDPTGLLDPSIPIELKPGSVTIGGHLSITNVVPGGGTLPAGSTFSIQGIGFTPLTNINLNTGVPATIQYVSPTEIQVTLGGALSLDGLEIDARDSGGAITYFSYLRGIPMGQTLRPLLARTEPVFSTNTAWEAILPRGISPQCPGFFTAIALQNPGLGAAQVTIEAHSAPGDLIGSASITMPPSGRFSHEVSEIFGAPLPGGGYLRVVASQPIQMLGLVGDDGTGTVEPVVLNVITAGPGPLPPVPVPAGQ